MPTTCNPQSLVADANCLGGLTAADLAAVKTAMLCNWINKPTNPNLIPDGVMYGSNGPMVPYEYVVYGLTPGATYQLTWGQNDGEYSTGGGVNTPRSGVGQTDTVTVSEFVSFISLYSYPFHTGNIPVTAVLTAV